MSFYLVIFSILLTTVFGYLRCCYNYWDLQGVRQLKTHFLFGNFFKLKTTHHAAIYAEVYAAFKSKAKFAGSYIFTKPILIVWDLDLVKHILIKDFSKFTDRFENYNKFEYLSLNLFNVGGEMWRSLRVKLTPAFTSGKMKFMFPTLVQTARQLDELVANETATSAAVELEVHDLIARFTTDVIGTCIFGIECNSLKDANVEFRHVGRLMFGHGSTPVKYRIFRQTYGHLFKYIRRQRFSSYLRDFIMKIVRETIELREKHNIKRNDFMDMLIEMKNTLNEQGKPSWSLKEIAAQVFIFFAAGFETSSSNTSYALFELAKNPAVQQKLRAEILQVLAKHNGELSYEAMMEMKYLNQAITETLRMYPPLAALTRFAVEDYEIPETGITMYKGQAVHIPIMQIHHDAEIYAEPEQFRPERFDSEQEQMRHPQAFLGFGDGPRNCIGMSFGRMQVRVALITLLSKYKFSLAPKMPNKVEFSERSMVLVPKQGVWLKLEKL